MEKKKKEFAFKAAIIKHDTLNAGFIEFPFDCEKEFGTKGQVKVKVYFDGHEYRGSLVKMGHKCHCIGITQELRKKLNKNPGDEVEVILTRDEDPRIVEVPEDISEILETSPEAKKAFHKLSYTNQKELVTWVTEAKKSETRTKRLNSFIEKILKTGVKGVS